MASIEQRGDSYRVVWRHERQKQFTTWPTETYAEEARGIVEGHRHKVTADQVYAYMGVLELGDADPDEMTFRQWCEQWLPSKTRITPGTRARYEQQLRDAIYPEFEADGLSAITGVRVGIWLNRLGETRGPKTVTRYYSLLFGAMEAAVRAGKLASNPCKQTDFVRDQVADDDTGEHKAVYLTPRQYELLRAAFPKQWHTLLDCLIETGVRWGEGTALARKHLIAPTDTSGPKLRVWRAWKRGKGGARYLGTTKGRGKRALAISTDLYVALLALVDGEPDDTLIFRRPDGSALDYSEMYNDVWAPSLLRARRCVNHPPADRGQRREGAHGRCRDFGGVRDDGQPCGARVVPGTTRCHSHYGPAPDAVSACGCAGVLIVDPSWHDLRHSLAAWLFSDPRVTPLAISRRLGHATLAITSDIYGDLMPEAEEIVVLAIAEARAAGQVRPVEVRERRRPVRRTVARRPRWQRQVVLAR